MFHPDDTEGLELAKVVFEHFHGTVFSGLIGGSVEVYVRSASWSEGTCAPRPISFPGAEGTNGVAASHAVAVVPIVSLPLAREVEKKGGWYDYLSDVVSRSQGASDRVGVFPIVVGEGDTSKSALADIFSSLQYIAAPSGLSDEEPLEQLACRDLVQGIVQMLRGPTSRLTVFISHTRRESDDEEDVPELIRLVREIIAETRLKSFFDASDLQPGRDWDATLRDRAADSALLAVRTDLYASRSWCQREMLIAKRAGMPVVILDSLGYGEERGSFIMDHVARIPVRADGQSWSKEDIRRGLNLLVDESLKREIWTLHRSLVSFDSGLNVDWWAPHAPEPVTLSSWLLGEGAAALKEDEIVILHPDPPLGEDEMSSLLQVVALAGHEGDLVITTPRGLASRGGQA